MKIPFKLAAWARGLYTPSAKEEPNADKFFEPTLPAGVKPAGLAMDSALTDVYAYANQVGNGDGFMGYPYLAELTQRPEYRMLSEKTAQAMCRKWIEFMSEGDKGDKAEVIKGIQEEMERLKVRDRFLTAATYDGFFGRCQIFIDLGADEGDELQTPIFNEQVKIKKGSLRRLKVIEPMFTYPADYSASNPLSESYYSPRNWYVMGKKVSGTRLMTFVSRPVPDILKPSYNFGGLSMSQLAKPYVDNWLKTRTSVSKLISNFSTTAVKTQMTNLLLGAGSAEGLAGEGDDLIARAQLFTAMRDNQGLMLLDNDTEELVQLNVPLGTLDKLQAQSQEHMASVSSTPVAILMGITPTGLNASSDGEIRIFYDHILQMQESLFGDPLRKLIDIIQLSKFGSIDPDIKFRFIPLWQQTEKELAENRKSDAETAQIYLEMGAVSADEVRSKIAKDAESGFEGLSGPAPEPEVDPADDVDMQDGKPTP